MVQITSRGNNKLGSLLMMMMMIEHDPSYRALVAKDARISFTIEHRPGTSMKHVDALSENPIAETEETNEVERLKEKNTQICYTLLTKSENPSIRSI